MRIPISIVLNGKRTFNLINTRERRRNAHGKPSKRRWSQTGGGFTTLREGHRHVYLVLDDMWAEIVAMRETKDFGAFVECVCAMIDHEIVHYIEPLAAPHIMAQAFGDIGAVVRGGWVESVLRKCQRSERRILR